MPFLFYFRSLHRLEALLVISGGYFFNNGPLCMINLTAIFLQTKV